MMIPEEFPNNQEIQRFMNLGEVFFRRVMRFSHRQPFPALRKKAFREGVDGFCQGFTKEVFALLLAACFHTFFSLNVKRGEMISEERDDHSRSFHCPKHARKKRDLLHRSHLLSHVKTGNYKQLTYVKLKQVLFRVISWAAR